MADLDKCSEVTNLNFDKEAPHLAICHKSQGYSANLRPQALLFKSGQQVATKEIIKSLEGVVSDAELTKMLADNKRQALREALEAAVKESYPDSYVWVYVVDYSEDLVLFEYDDAVHAAVYEITDEGVVSFNGEIHSNIKRRDMYVDGETGEELVKAVDWLKSAEVPKTEEEQSSEDSGEIEGDVQETETQDTPVQTEEEGNDMADKAKVENAQEELLKSGAVQELLKAAVADALAAKDAEIEKAAKDAKTEELVKGFAFVEEGEAAELVKALNGAEDVVAAELVKAMSAAQEKIESLEAELVKVKDDFGKQESVDGEPKDKINPENVDRQSALEKAVAKQLANRK